MEREIIDTALQNLQKEVSVITTWEETGTLDGVLTIEQNHKTFHFATEIKKEIRKHHLSQILNYQSSYGQIIVVAERILPDIKRELRNQKIAYLEANGNIYIDLPDFFLFFETNKPYRVKKEKGNRAFTKTGLKVVFHFLADKELINKPQREIAEITGVGLGNIPQVINGLKETGYLLKLNKKKYTWEKRQALLNKWIADYETILKPTLSRGKYSMKVPWQEVHLNNDITVWGGEPAADLLTNHLRPEKFTLYTKENQGSLLSNYKFIPKENGELTAYDLFWKQDQNTVTAPPLLVYTDLILEGGKRNKETAEIIFNEFIKPKL